MLDVGLIVYVLNFVIHGDRDVCKQLAGRHKWGSKQLIFLWRKGTPMQMATRGAPSPKTPAKEKFKLKLQIHS